MKKQIKTQENNSLYDNIELVSDDDADKVKIHKAKRHHRHHHHHHSDSSGSKVISDRKDSDGFDVDWDLIEENYQKAHSHHSHHHSGAHGEHSHASTSDTHTHTSDAHAQFSGTHNHASISSGRRKHSSKKKKWSVKKKILIGILLFILCIIIGILAAFFIMRYNGKKAMLNYENINIDVPEELDYEDGGNVVYYKGDKYRFNRQIATILFMGIDNRELQEDAAYGAGGQADALYLFTYDTVTGAIKVLCLNRDTITDISRYDEKGVYYDTTSTQLCLAYAYGDGKKLSAENQVTAVERLLYNIPINSYYAIDLSALEILNDDIGGVTVTPEYTFKSFTKGQKVTLKGGMAEEFVRFRDINLVDDNLRRMACQRQYINAFARQVVPAIKNDFQVPLNLYNDSSKYTVTNINISDMTYLASTLAFNYSGMELIKTTGKYKIVEGDESAQFQVNKTELFETVLDLFYTKIN